MEYDQAARKRLGRAVRAARTAAGYTKREDFAAPMGRSARQVQALENGESGVGPDTWASAATALGWPLQKVYDLLEGKPEGSTPSALASASDEELAAEVLRRMREAGGHGGDTAATKSPGSGPAHPQRAPLRAVASGDEGDEDQAAAADDAAAAARAEQQAEIDRMNARKGPQEPHQ